MGIIERSSSLLARPGTAAAASLPADEAKAIARCVRGTGSSLLWAVRLLPAPRRSAMHALYAFCREIDEIADGAASPLLKQALLLDWRTEIARLYAGRPRHSVTRALSEPVHAYSLRSEDFLAIIDGMDLDARADVQAPSLAELDLHCARVSVAVGLIAVRIFGVETAAGERVAVHLGRALQLTSILRDLAEDARRNRLYLPRELLRAHGIETTDPRSVLAHPALPNVCRDVAVLAEQHYAAATRAIATCPRHSMRPAALMLGIYRALLQELLASGWRCLEQPVRVPAWRQLALLLRHGLAEA
jgi:presqualene diphosphate synthase